MENLLVLLKKTVPGYIYFFILKRISTRELEHKKSIIDMIPCTMEPLHKNEVWSFNLKTFWFHLLAATDCSWISIQQQPINGSRKVSCWCLTLHSTPDLVKWGTCELMLPPLARLVELLYFHSRKSYSNFWHLHISACAERQLHESPRALAIKDCDEIIGVQIKNICSPIQETTDYYFVITSTRKYLKESYDWRWCKFQLPQITMFSFIFNFYLIPISSSFEVARICVNINQSLANLQASWNKV